MAAGLDRQFRHPERRHHQVGQRRAATGRPQHLRRRRQRHGGRPPDRRRQLAGRGHGPCRSAWPWRPDDGHRHPPGFRRRLLGRQQCHLRRQWFRRRHACLHRRQQPDAQRRHDPAGDLERRDRRPADDAHDRGRHAVADVRRHQQERPRHAHRRQLRRHAAGRRRPGVRGGRQRPRHFRERLPRRRPHADRRYRHHRQSLWLRSVRPQQGAPQGQPDRPGQHHERVQPLRLRLGVHGDDHAHRSGALRRRQRHGFQSPAGPHPLGRRRRRRERLRPDQVRRGHAPAHGRQCLRRHRSYDRHPLGRPRRQFRRRPGRRRQHGDHQCRWFVRHGFPRRRHLRDQPHLRPQPAEQRLRSRRRQGPDPEQRAHVRLDLGHPL